MLQLFPVGVQHNLLWNINFDGYMFEILLIAPLQFVGDFFDDRAETERGGSIPGVTCVDLCDFYHIRDHG